MEVIRDNWKLAVAATAASVLTGVVLKGSRTVTKKTISVPKKWVRVGTVKELLMYPIKSCKRVHVREATCTQIGLRASNSKYLRDRVFIVADTQGNYKSQRQMPKMALIETNVNDLENKVTLSAPDMEDITFTPDESPEFQRPGRVFEDIIPETFDCGDKVAQWLTAYLGRDGLRLLYHAREKTQRPVATYEQRFSKFAQTDKGAFQNITSYMLLSDVSVDDLNKRLNNPVTFKNFRPNILVTGVAEPFAEVFWGYVRIGESGSVFKSPKPCTRCKLTTVNPDKGEFYDDGEPLATLTKWKRTTGDDEIDEILKNKGIMGLEMGILEGEGHSIHVGDPVYVAVL